MGRYDVCQCCGSPLPEKFRGKYCENCRGFMAGAFERSEEGKALRRKQKRAKNKKKAEPWVGCVACGGELIVEGALYCKTCSKTVGLTAEQQIELMKEGTGVFEKRDSTLREIEKTAREKGLSYGTWRAILTMKKEKETKENTPDGSV